jgi:hypothetical protein
VFAEYRALADDPRARDVAQLQPIETASHTQALLHIGNAAPVALTGGFQRAFWVLGAIALLALPAIFALVRRNELSDAVAKTTVHEPRPALEPAR